MKIELEDLLNTAFKMLYKKYKLTKDEIAFIESMIRPMEIEGM